MAKPRLSMRKVKEVLRLKYDCHLKDRQIARSCGIARSTVADYVARAAAAGITWPVPDNLTDSALDSMLFASSVLPAASTRPLPDFETIYNELRDYKNLNLTLTQLWTEYKEDYPLLGYQYTQFCQHYRLWLKKLDYCMRQDHKPGEKLFVDYAKGLSIIDQKTGEIIPTDIFIAVWGASNYTFVEASLSQDVPSWLSSHVRALNYFGCSPAVLVPDCLKSGVTKACIYEPDINPSYMDFAQHYGIAVVPARPRHPRDKAKVETGALIAKRWILAVLRHKTFTSINELNAAISELLERLNNRPLRKLKKSRAELFESLDRPRAHQLPPSPYEYAQWKKVTVNIDYHIEVDAHYYSVPFALIRQKLDARITTSTVELFLKSERIAAHPRSRTPHAHTTLKEHMPPDHQKYLEWSPSRIISWAAQTGPATAKLVESIIASRTFPEQAYRSCLGILRLGKQYGTTRLEAAAIRALQFNTCSFKSVRSILARNLDRVKDQQPDQQQLPLSNHSNIRGRTYFN